MGAVFASSISSRVVPSSCDRSLICLSSQSCARERHLVPSRFAIAWATLSISDLVCSWSLETVMTRMPAYANAVLRAESFSCSASPAW
ncbi:MAG: hypothetical protein ACLTJ9_02760 [Eggerthella lenta]